VRVHGQELLADVAAPVAVLRDPEQVAAALRAGAAALGCPVLSEHRQLFEPEGVTAIAVIGESHLLASTYEELGVLAVGIQTCSGAMDLLDGLAAICGAIGADEVRSLLLLRRLEAPMQIVLQREGVAFRDGRLQLDGGPRRFSASTAIR
jgi:S-adenosylmethionine decarboxylase